jgi:hypothetical protein
VYPWKILVSSKMVWGMSDALIGFCDDVGIVRCNYDNYLSEHEKGGAANVVMMLKRSISGFYVSLLRLEFIIKLLFMIRHDAVEDVIDS